MDADAVNKELQERSLMTERRGLMFVAIGNFFDALTELVKDARTAMNAKVEADLKSDARRTR